MHSLTCINPELCCGCSVIELGNLSVTRTQQANARRCVNYQGEACPCSQTCGDWLRPKPKMLEGFLVLKGTEGTGFSMNGELGPANSTCMQFEVRCHLIHKHQRRIENSHSAFVVVCSF